LQMDQKTSDIPMASFTCILMRYCLYIFFLAKAPTLPQDCMTIVQKIIITIDAS